MMASALPKDSAFSRLAVALAFVPFCSLTQLHAETPSGGLSYNRDVRPILVDNCFACHGPDSASRQADLRIDREADATAPRDGGTPAIVKGKPNESELIARIRSTDPDVVMPPPASKKTLTPQQIETLDQWIASGAQYEKHWSFIAPTKPDVPKVDNPPFELRTPVDHFIAAGLAEAGLAPAEEADRRTLARRVSLDLTGLPPSPEVVERFLNDKSPDAYEQLVDRLLDSSAWGEHRGRYWLDAARYADTHGIHFDNYREIWTYRDWVIDAFNKNMPFDRFTIIQLAGDLLPNRTLDEQIGSGFNRCHITTNEGGVIPEEYAVLYVRDRVETTSQTWLGLTTGCAVCHDHKFDPISQKEFYELAAFFNNTTQNPMDGNIKDTPPVVVVPTDEDRPRWKALTTELPAAKQAIEDRKLAARGEFDQWLAAAKPEIITSRVPQKALAFKAPLTEGDGKSIHVTMDGSEKELPLKDSAKWQAGGPAGSALQVQGAAAETTEVGDVDRNQAFSVAAWVKLAPNDSLGAICSRMDDGNGYRGWDFWVQQRRIGTHIVNNWPGNALKVVAQAQVPGDVWTHVAMTYDGSGKASGVKVYYNGQPQATNVEQDSLTETIRTQVPFKIGQRNNGEPLSGAAIQDLRLYTRAIAAEEADVLSHAARFSTILATAADKRTDAEKNELYQWWLGSFDEPFQTATKTLASLEQEQSAIRTRGGIAYVMQEKPENAMAFILQRGEYDKRQDEVHPMTPAALPAFPDNLPRNRLGFAEWLLQPENPLTARVTVNRFWQELFGTGLVKTAGDFGITGSLPSNQALLDWLAVDFRENGWDVKRFFKMLVTSSAYRQAATTTPEKLLKDRDNRLLSRGPRFRMDAEMIRDSALQASGLLSRRIGGPSVKPYMPEGVWEAVAMDVSNTREYKRDKGEGLYRRSMYTFWKRAAPPAQMEIFNAPNRETCVVQRERTDTPLQALVTLNDEQYIEAARHLGELALKNGGDSNESRLDYIANRVLSRPFTAQEKSIITDVLQDLSKHYSANADDAKALIAVGESKADASLDPATLAAWTMTINEILNLDETLNK
jgi:mono/diheme cytochrome c family protein